MTTYRTQQYVLVDGELARIKAVEVAPGGALLTVRTKSGDVVTVDAGEVKAVSPLNHLNRIRLAVFKFTERAKRGESVSLAEVVSVRTTLKRLREFIQPRLTPADAKLQFDLQHAAFGLQQAQENLEQGRNPVSALQSATALLNAALEGTSERFSNLGHVRNLLNNPSRLPKSMKGSGADVARELYQRLSAFNVQLSSLLERSRNDKVSPKELQPFDQRVRQFMNESIIKNTMAEVALGNAHHTFANFFRNPKPYYLPNANREVRHVIRDAQTSVEAALEKLQRMSESVPRPPKSAKAISPRAMNVLRKIASAPNGGDVGELGLAKREAGGVRLALTPAGQAILEELFDAGLARPTALVGPSDHKRLRITDAGQAALAGKSSTAADELDDTLDDIRRYNPAEAREPEIGEIQELVNRMGKSAKVGPGFPASNKPQGRDTFALIKQGLEADAQAIAGMGSDVGRALQQFRKASARWSRFLSKQGDFAQKYPNVARIGKNHLDRQTVDFIMDRGFGTNKPEERVSSFAYFVRETAKLIDKVRAGEGY